ncbi:MAG: hypothetical protein JSU65_12115 [Candidatus Zixiibacteriota bacterium]|nr:MAG: hypothetical protein JSU65_12115 [candidate division Zixibacteria bacterium]
MLIKNTRFWPGLGILALAIALGCSNDEVIIDGGEELQPSVSSVSFSECLGQSVALAGLVPPDRSCIEYEYDAGSAVLKVRHANAGFNCCPENISATVDVSDGVITVTETETFGEHGGCSCLCLYNLDFEIKDLESGQYRVVIVELYLDGDDEPLDFVVDLGEIQVDTVCVDRDHYPWGVNPN